MIFLDLGYFKRDNKKKKMIKNLFTHEQKQDIKNKINYLNNILKKFQKEMIPFELYEYYNEKRILMIFREAFKKGIKCLENFYNFDFK